MKARTLGKALRVSACAVLLLLLSSPMNQAPAHGGSHHSGHSRCLDCDRAIRCNGWCQRCGVGYVGGREIPCKGCHHAVCSEDGGWCESCGVGYARGMTTKCRSCLTAIQHDAVCESCGFYYADGRRTTCGSCHALMLPGKTGWCSRCGIGHAKGVVTHCRTCLRAIQTDSGCRHCGRWYVDGQETRCPKCHALQKMHGCKARCHSCRGGHRHRGHQGCGHHGRRGAASR